MAVLLRALAAPLISLILLILASGLFNTFVSIRLEMEGYDPEIIGLVVSALHAGVLIGSLRIARWIARVGHIRSFTVFAAASALLVLGMGVWINPWYWSLLRLIGGVCMAGVFI